MNLSDGIRRGSALGAQGGLDHSVDAKAGLALYHDSVGDHYQPVARSKRKRLLRWLRTRASTESAALGYAQPLGLLIGAEDDW